MRASCMAPPVELMRPSPLRILLPALLLAVLAGCSTTQSCGGNQDYLQAQERPLLQLPPSMVASERIKPVVIPALAPDTQKLDPQPSCLDYPPPFFAKKPAPAKPAAPATATAPAATPTPAVPAPQEEPRAEPQPGTP